MCRLKLTLYTISYLWFIFFNLYILCIRSSLFASFFFCALKMGEMNHPEVWNHERPSSRRFYPKKYISATPWRDRLHSMWVAVSHDPRSSNEQIRFDNGRKNERAEITITTKTSQCENYPIVNGRGWLGMCLYMSYASCTFWVFTVLLSAVVCTDFWNINSMVLFAIAYHLLFLALIHTFSE